MKKYCIIEFAIEKAIFYYWHKDFNGKKRLGVMMNWYNGYKPMVFNSIAAAEAYIKKSGSVSAARGRVVPYDDLILYIAERKLREGI
jgi:hypothetical protein